MSSIETDPLFLLLQVFLFVGAVLPGLFIALSPFWAAWYRSRAPLWLTTRALAYSGTALVVNICIFLAIVVAAFVQRIDTYLLALQVMGIHCKP